jgi:hypothetical protein
LSNWVLAWLGRSVTARKTIGVTPNQATTASAQPRRPAAQAVARATDSGTAENSPG